MRGLFILTTIAFLSYLPVGNARGQYAEYSTESFNFAMQPGARSSTQTVPVLVNPFYQVPLPVRPLYEVAVRFDASITLHDLVITNTTNTPQPINTLYITGSIRLAYANQPEGMNGADSEIVSWQFKYLSDAIVPPLGSYEIPELTLVSDKSPPYSGWRRGFTPPPEYRFPYLTPNKAGGVGGQGSGWQMTRISNGKVENTFRAEPGFYFDGVGKLTYELNAVPEPSAFVLGAIGWIGLLAFSRQRTGRC